jgi:hypothetical protein
MLTNALQNCVETFYTEFNTLQLGNIESRTSNSMTVYAKCDGHRGDFYIIHPHSTIFGRELENSIKI